MSYNHLELPDISANLDRKRDIYGDDLRRETYQPGELIYTPLSDSEAVYLLIEGEVRLYRLGADGRRFTVATLQPGAAFGQASLLGSLESETYAEASEPSSVWIIADRSAKEIFSRNAGLSLSLLAGLSQRLVEVEARLESLAYKKVPAQLATLLLQMMDQTSGTVAGVTHQDLADMLGTYRETVSQAFREFRRRGLVKPGRKNVIILDPEGLRRIADQLD